MILELGLSKLVLSPSTDNLDAIKWQHPKLELWLERAQPRIGELRSHETLPYPGSSDACVWTHCSYGAVFGWYTISK